MDLTTKLLTTTCSAWSLLALAGVLIAGPALAAQNVLTWTDNSTNEQSFRIERKAGTCAATGTFTALASVAGNATTYTDTAVVVGNTYCYRVRAANASGVSAYSNTAQKTVQSSTTTSGTSTTTSSLAGCVYQWTMGPDGNLILTISCPK